MSLPLSCILFSILATALPHTFRRQSLIPQYVLDYAPLVWLDPSETYFPSSISAQLTHTHPTSGNTSIPFTPTLTNLDQLNTYPSVHLTANDDFTSPITAPWTTGRPNTGPSSIIILNSQPTHLDAYYFYFYAYNQGNTVLGQELGDHLGDWEHSMVRYQNNTPSAIWLSAHSAGQAFKYSALEAQTSSTQGQQNSRAVIYSARGSHANYATAGNHDHTIPGVPSEIGVLIDTTGKGELWDTVVDAWIYSVSFEEEMVFEALNGGPVDWLYYTGAWGDEQLSDDDPRQKQLFGVRKYAGGPTGPRDKQLNREKVCPDGALLVCVENEVLLPGS